MRVSYSKMFRGFCGEDIKIFFVHLSGKTYTVISILHKMFVLSYCLTVMWKLQMKNWLLVNVSNKET